MHCNYNFFSSHRFCFPLWNYIINHSSMWDDKACEKWSFDLTRDQIDSFFFQKKCKKLIYIISMKLTKEKGICQSKQMWLRQALLFLRLPTAFHQMRCTNHRFHLVSFHSRWSDKKKIPQLKMNTALCLPLFKTNIYDLFVRCHTVCNSCKQWQCIVFRSR